MKTHNTKWIILSGLAFVLALGVSFTYNVSSDWDVPDEYAKKENPVEADGKSIKLGGELYSLHCKSCHGKYGEGDGPKADGLETYPGDFTSDEFQDQADGALFYKTKFGRDEMPSFEKKIPYDDEIWHLVNYMRDLGQ